MKKIQVCVTFEFESDEEIDHSALIASIGDSLDTMRVAFDAQDAWISETREVK